jgi:hypothetical protein
MHSGTVMSFSIIGHVDSMSNMLQIMHNNVGISVKVTLSLYMIVQQFWH